VLLKGSGSVLAAPGHAPSVNASGNAALASAGTGDVLAGWIGGAWSQQAQFAEAEPLAAWRAAAHAVWLHGHAADEAMRPVLRAADLIECMTGAAGR